MQPNHPSHPVADHSQYYYPSMPAPMAHYAQYQPAQNAYYHHHPDQHYVVAPGQTPSQHLVMPVAQPPVIIMAPPPGAAYPSPYYGHPMYYQEMPPQHHQQHVPNHESSVRPLLTSTPLPDCTPPYQRKNYQRMRNDHCLDTLADISKISLGSPDETICDGTLPTQSEYKIVQQHKQQTMQQQRDHHLPINYKTKLCVNYANTGTCSRGQKCLFAHGEDDLCGSENARNTKYKTKLCRHYQSNKRHPNQCPYGNRCEFIHPDDEIYPKAATAEWKRHTFKNRFAQSRGGQADVTPEAIAETPSSLTRSASKPEPEKVMLKKRNIAGSMQCLARLDGDSSNSAAYKFGLRRLQPARSVLSLPKFERRRSISQQNLEQIGLKRSNSLEMIPTATVRR